MLNPIKVQNKTPAPIQITAEQLVLESVNRMKDRAKLPNQEKSKQEDEDFRFKRRQYWEQSIRRNLCSFHTYIRYARWEEDVGEIENSRSVFERALQFTGFKEATVWNCYIDMELRHKQYQHARNIFERSVKILPRYDDFWLRYAKFEETVGNFDNARQIFQRWLAWEPPAKAFLVFVDFECRMRDFNGARSVFERLLLIHPFPESYLRYCDFEIKMGEPARARNVFERCLDYFGEKNVDEMFILRFAAFEESEGEIERGRAIYKIGIDNMPESSAHDLYPSYLQFEKRYGGNTEIENAIIEQKKIQYQKILDENPNDYDSWFELSQLLIESGKYDEARELFRNCFIHKPNLEAEEKSEWSRFVQIILEWALFEEKQAKNNDNARKVYYDLVELTKQNTHFTFARMWVLYAYFEIRQKNIELCRQIFDQALLFCKTNGLRSCSIFKNYIDVESILRNEEKIRFLYKEFIQKEPDYLIAWVNYSKFEFRRGNIEFSKQILDEALENDLIQEKDLLLSVRIDLEKQIGSLDNVSELYDTFAHRANNFKLWNSWITFEAQERNDLERSREIFEEADKLLTSDKLQRKQLRELRVNFEEQYGTVESLQKAKDNLPTIKDGDLVFPEESVDAAASLLAAAQEWSASLSFN